MPNELKAAEIFSAGTWNGLSFTEADLDIIAASFVELAQAGRVPLKFGHNDEQPMTDGQPALGWVDRVWRDGTRLLADFSALPSVVYDAIKAQLYKFVSVELLQDAERDGKSFPWVLSAVSLLGADPPAVSNLGDLAALTMTRAGFRCATSRTFKRDSTNGAQSMAGENDNAELESLRAAVKKFSDENDALKLAREKDQAERLAEKAAAISAQVEAKFKSAIEAKRLLPSARERFIKWTMPKAAADVVNFSLAEVDSYIEENKITMSDPTPRSTVKAEDEEGKAPDEIVMGRTRKFMLANGEKDYARATIAVLREDPTLAEQYRSMPDNRR